MARQKKQTEAQLPMPVHADLPGEVIPEEKLKPEVQTLAEQAKSMKIDSHASNEAAGLFLRTVKAMMKKVAELCDPVCDAAFLAHKKACALRATLMNPLTSAENDVKGKVRKFLDDQEQLRRAEEQRLNAIAQKAAEDKAEQEAALLDAIGEEEAAAVVLATPVHAAPVVLAEVAKPEGVSKVQNWKWKVIDETKIPREYYVLDTVKINAVVRAMKEAAPQAIPGIESYDAGTVSVR